MKKVVLLVLLSFSSVVIADMDCSGGWCRGVPDHIIAWPSGKISIFPIGNNAIEGLTCNPVDSSRALNISISEGQDRMYSMLLASITANRPVLVRLPDEAVNCEVVYIRFEEEN